MEQLTVKEIKILADTVKEDRYLELIQVLMRDKRSSVKKIAVNLSKKLDDIRIEEKRIEEIFFYERDLFKKGFEIVAGVDEAGRGPLCGPVVAAAVIFDGNPQIMGLNDSKKIHPLKREVLFDKIIEQSLSFGIGIADHHEIDDINILEATMLAMRRAIGNCNIPPQYVLVDGNHLIRHLNTPQKSIIKGDSKSASIAAASILAKVTRDRIMAEYAVQYPEYDFDKNKGYGTESHIGILKKIGPCPIHRMSFIKNFI